MSKKCINITRGYPLILCTKFWLVLKWWSISCFLHLASKSTTPTKSDWKSYELTLWSSRGISLTWKHTLLRRSTETVIPLVVVLFSWDSSIQFRCVSMGFTWNQSPWVLTYGLLRNLVILGKLIEKDWGGCCNKMVKLRIFSEAIEDYDRGAPYPLCCSYWFWRVLAYY